MHKFKYYLALLAGVTILGLSAPVVWALEMPEYGGRSSDYHPPTRNPQGSTPTGLQPTNKNTIQSAPTSLNPQALTQTGGLKVLTSPDNGAATTVSEAPKPGEPINSLIIWIIGGILTLVAVVYIVAKPDKKPDNRGTPPEIPDSAPLVLAPKPKKTKKKVKNKSSKKRKSVRR